MDEPEYWWRCETRYYASCDPYDEDVTHITGPHVEFTPYLVVRTTPKGVWLRGIFGEELFVLGKAIRQWAVPTKEIAMRDEVARRKREVQGHEARMKRAKRSQEAVERMLKNADVGFH